MVQRGTHSVYYGIVLLCTKAKIQMKRYRDYPLIVQVNVREIII